MIRIHRPQLTALALFASLALQVVATPILYYTPALVNNGLGKSSSSQFTTAVTNAFGAGNVVEIPTFNNAADFDDGAALFVNARQGGDVLSAQEQANLLAFANAGGAVFFIGDHLSWQTWDNSFLNLFGDSFISWNGVNAAKATNALPDQFAPNTQIALSAPGGITGGNGKKLFTSFDNGGGRSMANLYGPQDNVIAFLDTNAFSGASNLALYSGLSSWMFETASGYEETRQGPGNPGGNTVPEAGSAAWLLLPMMVGLAALRRRVAVA
jgi:hypothetical protein